MVGYANDISIFMNANGNFSNNGKIIEKLRDVPSKFTNIHLPRRGLNPMRDCSMWDSSGILNIYLITHHLNVHQSQSPLKKVISKMKFGKAAGPSGIVVEMTRATVDTGVTMISGLAIAIIRDGKAQLTGSRVSLSAFIRERVMCSGLRQL